MTHGEHPNLKRVKGTLKRFCETCKRDMKTLNKCEMHTFREICYYCHLINQHMNGDKDSNNKSSPKKALTNQT